MDAPTRTRQRLAESPDYDGATPLLNARWEAFCVAYCGEYKGQAAAAYHEAGYKTKKKMTDAAAASRLLTNVNVRRRVDWLNKQALEALMNDRRAALERLAIIATVNYADFLDACGNVDIKKVRDPRLAPAVKRCTPIRDKEGYIVDYYLELYDAMKAPELLGFTERTEAAQVNQVLVIKA